MKVLLVLMSMDIGGAETHVLELARGLKKCGVQVLIASNGGAYTEELAKEQIPHFKVPLHSRHPKAMLCSLRKLRKIIKTEKPDVVHGHARIPSFLLSLLCKRMGFPFVTTAHWVFTVTPLLKLLSNWGYRTIAVSEDIKQYLIKNYQLYPQDISVTINGIPPEKFSLPKDTALCKELGLSENKRKIVSVSRMDTDRSLMAHLLIASAPVLLEKEDLEILLVGGGNDFEAVRQEAEAMNRKIGKQVIFLTGARTDINRFVSIADFVVAVSRSALECMCGSVPVIIAGNEGYLGIFSENTLQNAIQTNFCCRGMPEATQERLQADLCTLLDASSEALAAIGAFGKSVVESNYSANRMVRDNLAVYEEILQNGNRHKDFVISGYYGYKNSGDDALLHAILEQIRHFEPMARFTVLSANPKETRRIHGVHAVNRFCLPAVSKAIRNCTALISGGGSLIQDVTSTKSLLYYSNLIAYAKKHGKKVYIYANGIGPITKHSNEKIAEKALEQADLITLRDKQSFALLHKLCANPTKAVITADPAMALQAAPNANRMIEEEQLPHGTYVGISIRSWPCSVSVAEELAATADRLQQTHGLIPVFIPMQTPEDIAVCAQAVSCMQTKGYYLHNSYNYADIMAFCRTCKFVIGMRLHILLYAATVGTPCIGLIYDPKVLGCVSMLGLENYLLPLEQADHIALTARCETLLAHYDAVRESLTEKAAELQKNAFKNGEFAVKLLKNQEI